MGNMERAEQETWEKDLKRRGSAINAVLASLTHNGSGRENLKLIATQKGITPAQVIEALSKKDADALAKLLGIPHDDRRAEKAVMQNIFTAGYSAFEHARSQAYKLLNPKVN